MLSQVQGVECQVLDGVGPFLLIVLFENFARCAYLDQIILGDLSRITLDPTRYC